MKRIPLLTLAVVVAFHSHSLALPVEATGLQVIGVEVAGQNKAQSSLNAVVEAVRQTTLSAQVPGAVVALLVKAGDRVKAGQELLRLDARAAQQGVVGARAQVDAAQANLNVARQELDRQKLLLQKQYISQAAFERAQAQWDAAQAQVKALQAQTQTAQAQSGFFTVNAPYAGVVSDVQVTLGDMAMPGRALLTLHDPSALRVSAAVPQALLASVASQTQAVRYELPGMAGYETPQSARSIQLLPSVDPVTHTGQIRLALPVGIAGLVPGMFARVWIPAVASGQEGPERLYLPISAVVRRSEMTGVYVINPQGQPRLRQVRLGQVKADRVEVLSGLRKDDRVAAQPQLAAAAR